MSKYVKAAEANIASAKESNDERILLAAQTYATLALAYAQDTANLIAFERAQWEAWRQDELNPEGVELWRKAAEQVNERLGLS